ncbi:DegT/DnrJ/EryC1/StrS family aminotransferase [Flexithrix dorotheae]|uniref:DegT/DnrJ/EryC1/StrS family aminotransferase n=1 Tax=Flexithrix dorotheae TaxID=70993 RepID=UPI000377E866|nr:DegT/DnrJ/EryC1/StrS family aminotransferase [Flexithrix dorotheae]
MNIPFFSFDKMHLDCKEEIREEIGKVIDSNWYILGERLFEFEQKFAEFSETKFALGVGNGMDALLLSLLALEIGKGDEVIVPAHTFIATFMAVSQTGAKPVPVDVDSETGNINPYLIEKSITGKTKAIIPVHLYGNPCKMDEIMAVAKRNNLKIIEDNAQTVGGTYNGRKTGSFGDVNATSFYPIKNLGAFGDAGAITTNSQEIYEKVVRLRNYGSSEKYVHDEVGVNSRMDEMQAAVLLVKLKYLEKWNEERLHMANIYREGLSEISDLNVIWESTLQKSVHHVFAIQTPRRNELQQFMGKHGIQTLIHYPIPPHLQKAYANLGYKKGNFPITEEIANTELSLPVYPGLKRSEQDYIIEIIWRFFKEN